MGDTQTVPVTRALLKHLGPRPAILNAVAILGRALDAIRVKLFLVALKLSSVVAWRSAWVAAR
jgi:hypothetical protein